MTWDIRASNLATVIAHPALAISLAFGRNEDWTPCPSGPWVRRSTKSSGGWQPSSLRTWRATRLMAQDEVWTVRGLAAHRATLDDLIAEHGGRIANTAGDSVLAEYSSAVDAVACAVEVQERIGSETGGPKLQRVTNANERPLPAGSGLDDAR
jgi:hypothetical protein